MKKNTNQVVSSVGLTLRSIPCESSERAEAVGIPIARALVAAQAKEKIKSELYTVVVSLPYPPLLPNCGWRVAAIILNQCSGNTSDNRGDHQLLPT